MAEFCLNCFNEEFNKQYSEHDVLLCNDYCEGCGKLKPCVISIRRNNLFGLIFKKPINK